MHINSISKHSHKSAFQLYPWLLITLVMVLAGVLYFYRIDSEGLWIDELTSIEDKKLA